MRSSESARYTGNARVMARLLPILVFLGVALWLAIAAGRRSAAGRDPRAYRPRSRFRDGFARRESDAGCAVRRRDLAGLRDAYSGAALDPSRPLVRCTRCLAFYHAESAAVLVRENGGRCAACGGTAFRAVDVTGD